MATDRPAAAKGAKRAIEPLAKGLSSLEMLSLMHRQAVREVVVVETAPSRYHLEAVISWRAGRQVLMGTLGPRTYRSLDTVATHLKTLGIGRITTRLELLG